METTPLSDTEAHDIKRRICDGFGVTVEEVDAFDRHARGPEERAARAEGERLVMERVDTVLGEMSAALGDVLGVPVRLVMADG